MTAKFEGRWIPYVTLGIAYVTIGILIAWSLSTYLFDTSSSESTTGNMDAQYCVDMMDDHVRGIQHCNRAIESGELNIDQLSSTISNRGWHYRRLGRNPEAMADYTRAIELNENSIAYYNRGFIFEEMGDRERARADFLRAFQLTPELDTLRDKAREYGITNPDYSR